MSFETNKAFAAILLAGIIAMVAGIVARGLVHPAELAVDEQAYPIAVAEGVGAAAPAAPAEEVLEPIEPLLAAANPEQGQALTRACQSCHSFDKGGANKVGPNLYGVVGADVAAHGDYAYSDVLQAAEGAWSYEALNAFLANPKGYAPGTKMSYGGMKKASDRANLIAYLRTLSDDPPPLP